MIRRHLTRGLARIAGLALLAAGLAGPAPAFPETIVVEPVFSTLAAYTFDGEAPAAGPDTFRVYEKARGRVSRSPAFRWSGDFSVEVREMAGDGDFPELQGYFELRETGQLFAHFAFLVTDPAEEFNIALAGPAWFRLGKDGIAFWLSSRERRLIHMSDSIPKKLFELSPYTWYQVDLLYDLDRGTYDLTIEEEGVEKPRVTLVDQPNASAQPGSAVDKFSFIGDRGEDTSNAVYYVDDIVIGADEKIDPPSFVAPGRRRFFVESLVETTETLENAPAARLEKAADEAFLARDPTAAGDLYEEALDLVGNGPGSRSLLLKLADVAFLEGDLAAEKELREEIYGTLEER